MVRSSAPSVAPGAPARRTRSRARPARPRWASSRHDRPRRGMPSESAPGGRLQAVYMTMGAHDLVIVYEAPDDAIAARFSLGLGMLGNVRSTTMKAFPEAAYREIIASLG